MPEEFCGISASESFAQLPREDLDGPGLERINPVRVQQMDSVDDPGEMQEVGKRWFCKK